MTDASPRHCVHYLPATLRGNWELGIHRLHFSFSNFLVEEAEEDLPQMLDAAHDGKIFTEYCLGK